MYYEIDETAARRAKEANSFRDYKPGSATASYRASVDKAIEIAETQKSQVDPMYHEKIDALLDRYARKLAENMNDGFRIDARVPSIMIAGGSNFPVRKKEKQNAARDRNMEEWKYIQGLLDKIRSTGKGGISADDPDAVDKLKARLEALEQSQQYMKEVNAYYRKHKTLEGCPVFCGDDAILDEVACTIRTSWRENPKPFEHWALSNNNANMKRIRERIAELERRADNPETGWKFNGGEVVANIEENRLQILFDEKPNESLRSTLKSNGFRWAPSQSAWQRQLTKNAVAAAKYVLKGVDVNG